MIWAFHSRTLPTRMSVRSHENLYTDVRSSIVLKSRTGNDSNAPSADERMDTSTQGVSFRRQRSEAWCRLPDTNPENMTLWRETRHKQPYGVPVSASSVQNLCRSYGDAYRAGAREKMEWKLPGVGSGCLGSGGKCSGGHAAVGPGATKLYTEWPTVRGVTSSSAKLPRSKNQSLPLFPSSLPKLGRSTTAQGTKKPSVRRNALSKEATVQTDISTHTPCSSPLGNWSSPTLSSGNRNELHSFKLSSGHTYKLKATCEI